MPDGSRVLELDVVGEYSDGRWRGASLTHSLTHGSFRCGGLYQLGSARLGSAKEAQKHEKNQKEIQIQKQKQKYKKRGEAQAWRKDDPSEPSNEDEPILNIAQDDDEDKAEDEAGRCQNRVWSRPRRESGGEGEAEEQPVVKRGRGRPRKYPKTVPARPRGRPRKAAPAIM